MELACGGLLVRHGWGEVFCMEGGRGLLNLDEMTFFTNKDDVKTL